MFHLLVNALQGTVCEMCELYTAKNGTPETDNQEEAALDAVGSEVRGEGGFTGPLPHPYNTGTEQPHPHIRALWLSFCNMFMP